MRPGLADAVRSAGDGVTTPDGALVTVNGSYPALGRLSAPVAAWAPDPARLGAAWQAGSDGGIFTRGGAGFYGSAEKVQLARPIVGMAATPSGHGYWLVASDGGVFAFGDARFYGSTGAVRLARPIVGMAATASGRGYWLVASDGGVFAFGDARFHGSTSRVHLARPIVGLAPTASGAGYWLAAADGGVFGFGDAAFLGSASPATARGAAPAVSVVAHGRGYDVVQADGAIWTFAPGSSPSTARLPVLDAQRASLEQAQAERVAVDVALAEVGKPYIEGAAGPGAFDCSGLTLYAYRAAGVNLPRTAAEQFAAERHVTASQLRPGDLLFFYSGITHVGIYLGNGLMVDAPHTGAVVRVEAFRWFGPLMGAARPA